MSVDWPDKRFRSRLTDVRAINSAQEKGTVKAQLHVALSFVNCLFVSSCSTHSSRGFGTSSTDLHTDVRSGNQDLGDRNAMYQLACSRKNVHL